VVLTSRFEEALTFALRTHRNQLRKGTSTPYVEHVLGVASLALNDDADEDEAIAAPPQEAMENQDRLAMRARKEAYGAHAAAVWASVVLVSASDKLHNARAIVKDFRAVSDGRWDRITAGIEGALASPSAR
jgi:GTP pyrophosphokinase